MMFWNLADHGKTAPQSPGLASFPAPSQGGGPTVVMLPLLNLVLAGYRVLSGPYFPLLQRTCRTRTQSTQFTLLHQAQSSQLLQATRPLRSFLLWGTPDQSHPTQPWQCIQVPFRSAFRGNRLRWLGSCLELDTLGPQGPAGEPFSQDTRTLPNPCHSEQHSTCMHGTHSAVHGQPGFLLDRGSMVWPKSPG